MCPCESLAADGQIGRCASAHRPRGTGGRCRPLDPLSSVPGREKAVPGVPYVSVVRAGPCFVRVRPDLGLPTAAAIGLRCPPFGLKGGKGVALATLWPDLGPDRPWRESRKIFPRTGCPSIARIFTRIDRAGAPPRIPPGARAPPFARSRSPAP